MFERGTLNLVAYFPSIDQHVADAVCERLNNAIAQARAEGEAAGERIGLQTALGVLIMYSSDKWQTNEGLKWLNAAYDKIKSFVDIPPADTQTEAEG